MLIQNITDEEIQFCECWYNPICLAESLFSDFDNLSEFKDKFSKLRFYQYPMLSSEPIIDTEQPALSKKENFQLRIGAGEIYNLGSRKYGKSLITEKIDIPISMLHDDNFWCGFTSVDAIHLQDILDVVTRASTNHPILSMWKKRFRASPKYELEARNGWLLQGINMNVQAKEPGKQFFGKHVMKLWIEEASLETNKVYEKRKDSLSEMGAVIRSSGMTNFTRHTPAGRAFYDPANKARICNLPQYVNPTFDEKEERERAKEYGGKESASYRVFVGGEVIEDGISEFDMSRIEKFINEHIELKVFEVKKEDFSLFKNIIIVERPANAERIFLSADIGDGAGGTEILVHSEIGNKYNYLYRIALYNLKDDEQEEIFDYLIQKLNANVVGLDCGDGTGRAIYRRLEKKYSKDNLVYYGGGLKIGVDFQKNTTGEIALENGEPIFIEEFMSEWGVRRLKTLLYEGRINMPKDFKYERQLNSVISRTVGTRTVYACLSEDGDHVFDAHKVFAIAQWLKKDFNKTPKMKREMGAGACSWKKTKSPTALKIILNKEIECTEIEYKQSIRSYLVNECTRLSMNNDEQATQFISNEIKRLDKIFNK